MEISELELTEAVASAMSAGRAEAFHRVQQFMLAEQEKITDECENIAHGLVKAAAEEKDLSDEELKEITSSSGSIPPLRTNTSDEPTT